jgi:NAD(P)-dependent dehydrogenase (short-subunit alcohol dehydrogenase family)
MNLPNFSLAGKTALVTGASGGLGQGFAVALAAAGADVVITELPHKLESCASTLEMVRAHGRSTKAIGLDVQSVTQCQQAALEAGTVDILVNNAGVNRVQWAEDVTEENWDLVLNTNLKGTFFLTQAVGKLEGRAVESSTSPRKMA